MKKLLRIFLLGVAAIGALLLVLTVALRTAFPSSKLRRLAEDELRKQLHREARIGDIELSPWGLAVKDFRLSEAPDLSAGTFLSVERASLRWALLPLLSRTVLIEELALEKPQIELVRLADGKTLNVSDLTGGVSSPTSHTTAPHPQSLSPGERVAEGRVRGSDNQGWSWRIDEIHLSHGAIRFLDRSPAGQTTRLSDIELVIRGISPTRLQGRLTVSGLENPAYKARDLFVEWALRDMDANLKRLNGWMRLKQGRGAIENLSGLAAASSGARLAFTPIVVLQNLDRLGLVRLGLPDFSHLAIDNIEGNYLFVNGVMKINAFRIASPQLSIGAQGYVDLARGDLSIDVTLDAPRRTFLGEMHLKMRLTGTLSHPKADLESLKKKAFKATVKQLLQQPEQLKDIGNTLKNIFR